jgi:FAD/FMN-containing dehydrogenase
VFDRIESTRRHAYVRSYDAWRRAAATAIQFPHAEDELFGIADRIDLSHWLLP